MSRLDAVVFAHLSASRAVWSETMVCGAGATTLGGAGDAEIAGGGSGAEIAKAAGGAGIAEAAGGAGIAEVAGGVAIAGGAGGAGIAGGGSGAGIAGWAGGAGIAGANGPGVGRWKREQSNRMNARTGTSWSKGACTSTVKTWATSSSMSVFQRVSAGGRSFMIGDMTTMIEAAESMRPDNAVAFAAANPKSRRPILTPSKSGGANAKVSHHLLNGGFVCITAIFPTVPRTRAVIPTHSIAVAGPYFICKAAHFMAKDAKLMKVSTQSFPEIAPGFFTRLGVILFLSSTSSMASWDMQSSSLPSRTSD